MTTRLTILGSTGSIGRSALRVVRNYPGRFEIVALAAHSDIDELARQAEEFRPKIVAVADESAALAFERRWAGGKILRGPNALEQAAAEEADVVLCAVVGSVGLPAILAAIDAGHRVALANKEPMIMAGRLITAAAARAAVKIVPVDSEHSALFQCLEGRNIEDVHKVYLTASGGPFYGRPSESLRQITPREATNHPTWDMGAKISVDSATLMNKGLEIIETMWLFGLPLEKIDVVIHPQSIVHGLVEFTDGNILAHLGVTDMVMPIQFALTWPERVICPMARLDLTRMGALSFAAPDVREFPCLALAMAAAREGGTAGAVLNAANEAAVEAFRAGRLPFLGIAELVRRVMDEVPVQDDSTLEAVLEADAQARRRAEGLVAGGVLSSR
jgi:1-deoxy-D-xylulose-5-phosphate reductoisomerase